jgi:ribose/xylose/arabinose/galactoside ABC-type transport system permease subunit
LIAVALVFSWLRPEFIGANNANKIIHAAGISAIMFLGATWVIAAGEIDVSFMSVAALSDMLVAGLIQHGFDWGTATCIGLTAGVIFGLLNGILVGYLGLPALITTIATGGCAQSAAAAIGSGASLSIPSGGFVTEFLALNLGVLPAVTLLAAILYAIGWYAQERLVFGHYIYAMEQNRRAVVEAGIPVKRLLVILFVISGVTASIAGVLLTADLSSGQPRIGLSYFLDGLTAILLGGMVVKMAQPNLLGTLVGVLLLSILVSGTALLGWPDWQREIIKGCLLMLGAAIVVRTHPLGQSGAGSRSP